MDFRELQQFLDPEGLVAVVDQEGSERVQVVQLEHPGLELHLAVEVKHPGIGLAVQLQVPVPVGSGVRVIGLAHDKAVDVHHDDGEKGPVGVEGQLGPLRRVGD